MKNALLKKYCPRCKKEVAVQKNGNNHSGKQSYLCKCGRQLVDRKYPIEVQSLAVLIYHYKKKKSFRAVAKIFCTVPNTIRNWKELNIDYKIPDKAQIKTLKSYKSQCEKVKLLNDKIAQLDISLKYWQYEKQIKELQRELVKPNCYERKRTGINKEISRIYDEIKNLGEIKYKFYSTANIRKLLSETEEKHNKQNEIKKEIETQCVYARDNYDLNEIIKFLEKICT